MLVPCCSNIVVLGLLLPAYSYTGMDGPAHMSEETEGAIPNRGSRQHTFCCYPNLYLWKPVVAQSRRSCPN
jgi:hypothetical protein